ncbi:MAG: hypothetical protein IPO08_22170 [Xanthomonadales bacterium]|nr:hypothetical protein [Xanthomonadales bacterium]
MYLPDLGEAFADAYERCGIDPASLTASHFVTARRTLAQLLMLLKSEGVAEHQISYWTADLTTNEGAIALPSDTIDITDLVLRVDDVDRPLTRISKERWLAISSKETLNAPAEYWISHEWASDVGSLMDGNGVFSPGAYGETATTDPGTRTGPTLVLYPVPETTGYSVYGYRVRSTEDKTKATDLLPVREAWSEAIIAGLAPLIYLKQSEIDEKRMKRLEERAAMALQAAKRLDRNRAPTVLSGNFRNSRMRRLGP